MIDLLLSKIDKEHQLFWNMFPICSNSYWIWIPLY